MTHNPLIISSPFSAYPEKNHFTQPNRASYECFLTEKVKDAITPLFTTILQLPFENALEVFKDNLENIKLLSEKEKQFSLKIISNVAFKAVNFLVERNFLDKALNLAKEIPNVKLRDKALFSLVSKLASHEYMEILMIYDDTSSKSPWRLKLLEKVNNILTKQKSCNSNVEIILNIIKNDIESIKKSWKEDKTNKKLKSYGEEGSEFFKKNNSSLKSKNSQLEKMKIEIDEFYKEYFNKCKIHSSAVRNPFFEFSSKIEYHINKFLVELSKNYEEGSLTYNNFKEKILILNIKKICELLIFSELNQLISNLLIREVKRSNNFLTHKQMIHYIFTKYAELGYLEVGLIDILKIYSEESNKEEIIDAENEIVEKVSQLFENVLTKEKMYKFLSLNACAEGDFAKGVEFAKKTLEPGKQIKKCIYTWADRFFKQIENKIFREKKAFT